MRCGLEAIPGEPEGYGRPEESVWPDMEFINYASLKKQIDFQ
jgi:hypothetical protein